MKSVRKGISAALAGLMVFLAVFTYNMSEAQAAGGIEITEAAGYAEGAYAEFTTGLSAKGYNAYVKKSSQADSAYMKLDNELIRVYPDYIRVDAVGLEAGDYVIKIVPVYGGTEKPSEAAATAALSVYSHDRTGFAWVDGTASGAYNENGTLKSNAVVVYVTEETKDTVSATVSGTVCSGVQNILTAYKKAKTNAAPLDIRIIGNITDPAVLDKGDLLVDGVLAGLTIEGIGEDATANGWGIRIKGSSNVEVRNLGIMNVNSGEGDNIGLQQNNNHVWVHNCDFFYGHAGSDADQVKGDGALDTKTSTYITHSYNHFYDNGKCNLQGMKSEKETNYITYHHNWYDHSDSRHPRIRTCSVHSYNNYFDGNAKYGVGVTMGASAFVENNYFRNCKYPVLSSGQGSDKVTGGTFSGETGGIVKTFNNYIEGAKAFVTYQDNNTEFDAYAVSSADEQVPSSVKTLSGGTAYNNFDTSSIMYSYTAQSPEDAKAAVVARAGRVNGGDFKYDFSGKTYQQKDGNGVMQTVTADEYYHVDDELKALVVNYKTSLVAVGGNPLGGGGSTTPVKPTKPSESETKSTEAGTEVSGSTGATSATKPSTNPGTTGSYVHNFTASGTTSSVYTITGSLANKGTVNYAGLTLSKCLKMESSTSIKFATPSSGKLILVFGGSTAASGKAVKVNGTKYTCGSDGIATIDISGSKDITITKGDSINLFYINYVTEGSSENPSEPATEPSTQAPAQKKTESATKATQASTTKPAEATKATQVPATKPAESATKATEATKPGTSDKKFTSAGGFNESIYAQISGVKDSDITGVSYSGTASGELTGQDLEYLVRDNGNGVRIDIPGVKPGTYTLTVTTKSGTITKSGISVDAQDRSGYAHFNYTAGVGAYNDDGSLKDNAIVLYVTDDNKNSVELTYGGITVKGIGNILNSVGKECGEAGHEGQCKKTSGNKTIYAKANTNQGIIQKLAENKVPLVVRFIGTVSDSGLYKRGTFDASTGLIDGLTAYDGDDFGGSVGDNGHMARIKSGRDITLEGIGTDATIDGWGFHFMAESAQPDLGKSFEVRNLKFINTPEDAIGMEGVQASANVNSDLSASVEHCWIHNNEYYCPSISNPAESDKSEGDGSVDFKRGQYFTCSYNYFEGCHKTNLVGSSDSSLQYNLTYHHNYWKLCKARGPLTRNANVHMYNNIYEGQTDYAMNVRANAYIFSEYNLFYMCKNPQRVDSGAIKSYNDSFSSCINDMGGTVVENKTDPVANSCKFAAKGIDYSRFDTDSSLSYIPTGDYELQTSITEAHKTIASRTGVLKENPVAAGDVSMSSISYVPSGVTPVDVTELPSTLTPGKLNKTVYAFTVGGTVDVTVKYADDTLAGTGALVNEAGECFLVASGTARDLPAGTYMIQPYNFQPGDGKTMETGTFKQVTIDSLEITSSDPNAHYHKYELVETTAATCTSEGSKIYRCSCGDTKTEPVAKLDHTYGAWTVTKEATETETGLKVRKCTVCGYEDPQKIPAKGTSGGGSSEPAEAGAYAHNFTTSGTTSSVYTITGSTTTSKGSVTYAGLTLTTALKMESSTSIKFTAPSDGKLVLVFGGSAAASGKTVKVNGNSYTCGSDGIATVEVKAGEVTIAKGDSINLFYMNFEADGSSTTDPTKPANPDIPSADKKNGLVYSDSAKCWYYYKDDIVDKDYKGLAQANNKWWYVENGTINFTYTGMAYGNGRWWYMSNGAIDFKYTGMAYGNNRWWYFNNGAIDFKYTGMAYGNGRWWYFNNGAIDFKYTGMAYGNNRWWYFNNGAIDFKYTGTAYYKRWWYFSNGSINFTYTGMGYANNNWWYFSNGAINFNYTGIGQNNAGQWYFKNGKIAFNYSGKVVFNSKTYKISKGKVVG